MRESERLQEHLRGIQDGQTGALERLEGQHKKIGWQKLRELKIGQALRNFRLGRSASARANEIKEDELIVP
jgi:hypothetical protein